MTTVLVVDESKLRDRDRGPTRVLLAELNADEDFGRYVSVAAQTGGAVWVIAGHAYPLVDVFGRCELLEGPLAPDLLITYVARRERLARELTNRKRVRSSFAVRHWPATPEGVAPMVLCTPYGIVVTDGRRQLAAGAP